MRWLALCCTTEAPPGDRDALGWLALSFTPRVARLEDAVVAEVSASLRLFRGARALRLRLQAEAAHAGYILVGVAALFSSDANVRQQAVSGVLFYLLAYTVSNALAFGSLIAVGSHGKEAVSYEDLAGVENGQHRAAQEEHQRGDDVAGDLPENALHEEERDAIRHDVDEDERSPPGLDGDGSSALARHERGDGPKADRGADLGHFADARHDVEPPGDLDGVAQLDLVVEGMESPQSIVTIEEAIGRAPDRPCPGL